MLTGVHVLLTYQCTGECDHCFLHCGPQREGTFTLSQLRELLHEVKQIGTIKTVYFEGGEPFLFYAVLLAGLRMVRDADLRSGIVTNGYWATSQEDAEQWLRPTVGLGVADFSVSDDEFHSSKGDESPGAIAYRAARTLGLPCARICIERPTCAPSDCGRGKGQPVTGGGVLFKGRAAEKLTAGLPVRPWRELTTCPHEELASPERVHVDAFGNVQVCQGRDQSSDRGAAGRGWPCTPRRAFRRGGGRRLCGRVPSLLHGEKIVAAGFPAASRAGSGLRIVRTIMRKTSSLFSSPFGKV